MADVDLRQHLAAERTTLAELRTSLALLGIGFVVARFSIETGERRLGPAVGVTLVMLGGLMAALSTGHYLRLVRRLNQVQGLAERPSLTTVAFCVIVAMAAVVLTAYLLLTSPAPAFRMLP